jgi:membrane protein YqaA with SNARE-associated domain
VDPILGDIIVIIAGVKRYSPKKYIISMSIGKIIRAVAIVFFTSWMTNYYFVLPWQSECINF